MYEHPLLSLEKGALLLRWTCSPGSESPCRSGRNSYRQPSIYSLDIRLQKAFRVGPGDLNFAVDCFNCTNTGNKFVSQTTFGRVPGPTVGNTSVPNTSTPNANFANPNNPGTPFTTQLSVRYDF